MARTKEQDNASGSSLENTTSLDDHDEVGSDVYEVSHNCGTDPLINLLDTVMNHEADVNRVGDEDHIPSPEPRSHGDFESRSELIVLQKKDPSLSKIWDQVVFKSEVEVAAVCYYIDSGVLMRK